MFKIILAASLLTLIPQPPLRSSDIRHQVERERARERELYLRELRQHESECLRERQRIDREYQLRLKMIEERRR